MSSLDQLALKALERLIPPETFQMLQPSNVRNIINAVGSKLNDIEQQQMRIEKTQQQILDILNERNNGGSGKPVLGIVDGNSTGTHG